MSDGRVAGAVVHVQLAVAQLAARSPSSSGRVTSHRAAPAAERRATRRAAPRRTSSGMPCSRMISVGEDVVLLDRLAVVAEPRRQRAQRGDLRARALARAARRGRVWSMCWWVMTMQLEVLDPVPERASPRSSTSSDLPEFGPDVDERQRRVLDQLAVDAPDRERRRDRDAVDAGLGGPGVEVLCARRRRSRADQPEHLVAPALHVLAARRATPA